MNAGKTVFAQILEHLPRYEFDKFVEKYEGNHRVRRFPCYDQFFCLAYAQLTYRESLRDIETCLNSHHEKLYHIETFEFLPKPGKSSFLRKQESSPFNGFIDSRFRGNDKKVRFSKVSQGKFSAACGGVSH